MAKTKKTRAVPKTKLGSGRSMQGMAEFLSGIAADDDSTAAGTIGIISSDLARFSDFSTCLLSLIRPTTERIVWVRGMDVCGNLNRIIKDMRGDHLFLLGDDHTFEPGILVKLLEHLERPEVDAVVPLVMKKQAPFEPVVYSSSVVNPDDGLTYYQHAELPEHGLIQLHAAGSAGMLIKREVLKDILQHDPPVFMTTDGMQNEDLHLCRKIRERRERLGLEGSGIWCDVDTRMGHIGVFAIYPFWQGDGRYGTIMDLGNGHFTPLFAVDPGDDPELDTPLLDDAA